MGDDSTPGSRLRLSASAPPSERGHERTVFLLEHEGEPDAGGWVLLRWLKTRQLLEAVPPGVPGREDDAWSVRLGSAGGTVNELHKLNVEDDASHAQSHIWATGLRGYLNSLEASGDIVGHSDALPPSLATDPPPRGAVSVERLQSGAAWLMTALERRDKQLDALEQQLSSLRAELAARIAEAPTPGRPVGSRERREEEGGAAAASGASAVAGAGGSPSSSAAAAGSAGGAVAVHGGAAAGGALAELRIAPQKRARVHVECPAADAKVVSAGSTEEEEEEEEDDDEEEEEDGSDGADGSSTGRGGRRRRGTKAASAKAGSGGAGSRAVALRSCANGGVPSWSYMAESEYSRFVKGVASRLRLGSGDSVLDLAGGDCGSSASAIQQLYRGQLHVMALLPSSSAAKQHAANQQLSAGSARSKLLPSYPRTYAPVNACVASLDHLGWVPQRAFDGAITFGALGALRSRRKICRVFQSVLRAVHPGGRFIIADAEHPQHCPQGEAASAAGRAAHLANKATGGPLASTGGSDASADDADEGCGSCHWRAAAPLAFWTSCVPMHMAVSLTAVEHTDLPGTASHACAARHFALIAQRSSAQQEMAVTAEAGSDGGKVAVLLSLAGGSADGNWLRRVQHLKEASIDNKRMYCGLHGYSLIIGEDLQHWRESGWDKVKLLAAQLWKYEWLLWVPVDSVFADSASSLSAITDDTRAHLVALQDAGGDGMGGGVLSEPLLIRGKSDWSKKFLDDWWGYYADGFAGSEREALQQLLMVMHEEERARRVRILELDPLLTVVTASEPLAWQAPYRPSSLLVTFDASLLYSDSRSERAAASTSVCPLRSSDRQMLRCLHAYTSHHLKAIQAADARYSPPLVYDVADTPAVTISDGAKDGDDDKADGADGSKAGGGKDASDGKPSGRRDGGDGGDGGDSALGGDGDLAGGWLTPRLPTGRQPAGGGGRGDALTCPAMLPGSKMRALPSQLPGYAIDLMEASSKAGGATHSGGDGGGGGAGGEKAGGGRKDREYWEHGACASGSTWARMPRSQLTKHVLAFGEKLGLSEGMSVLDVGSTCGHALSILQERHSHKLRAVGVDGSKASIKYARRTAKGSNSFCVGDAKRLAGVADDSFDAAFTMSSLAQLTSEREVCAVARELGRVIRPGGKAMLISVPKSNCAVTQDADWDCPRCYWRLRGIEKGFWPKCLQAALSADAPGGAYRIEFLSNTALFPFKPAAYCQREHYTVVIHKKQPASVYIYQQPRAKLAVLTVASTPPIGEYGKQKVHYLTELSIENKRQHAAQRGFDLVVAQNLAHGRTARWDKVMLLRRMLSRYQWVHWVDLDTLFMNMKRDPMAFLDPAYDLHVAKDANGLNTGSFYVKASEWSHNFLRRVWEHNDNGKGESDQRSFAAVISELSAEERTAHVKYYSQKLFNEYPDPIVNFKNWRGHFRCAAALVHRAAPHVALLRFARRLAPPSSPHATATPSATRSHSLSTPLNSSSSSLSSF